MPGRTHPRADSTKRTAPRLQGGKPRPTKPRKGGKQKLDLLVQGVSKVALNPAPGPELVVGLICAIGTNTKILTDLIEEEFQRAGFRTYLIHVIENLRLIERWSQLPRKPLDERYAALMTAGNEFRAELGRKDALALLAIGNINQLRERETGSDKTPLQRTVYIVRSLKNPDEVRTLRSIYGSNFIAISAYGSEEARTEKLAKDIAASRAALNTNFKKEATALVQRDAKEIDVDHGQDLRGAFPLADFFINAEETDEVKRALRRSVSLFLGDFRESPLRVEYGMFQAHGASVRSAALGRQVGAAICDESGEIVALGCNEVPKAFGGVYWPDDSYDQRDHQKGYDSNDLMKRHLVEDALALIKKGGWLSPEFSDLPLEQLLSQALGKEGILSDSQMMGIIEYGRAVHAEMAAITDAARRGISVRGCTLYTTTFPCHNCAKHIVAAGIAQVVYIEPYPKSYAMTLHDDAISFEQPIEGRVQFKPFCGVAPRQYLRLFSMGDSVRKVGGRVAEWQASTALPREMEDPRLYIMKEAEKGALLDELLAVKNIKPSSKPLDV
jgi:deoxycytidylate deaminase